ncbi:TetR family transcriptional regulator, partial [Streptomyces sp. NPDC048279]
TPRAEVFGADVPGAHKYSQRSWLRSDGEGDAAATVDHALGYVQTAFGTEAAPGAAAGGSPAALFGGPTGHPDDVVVLVSRRDAPLWRVVQEIEAAFGRA